MKKYTYLIISILLIACNKDNPPVPKVDDGETTESEVINFTIEKDKTTGKDYAINPFDYAPMTAGIKFLLTSKEETKVTIVVTIKGQKNSPDFVKKYTFNSDSVNNQWLPIIGMYDGDNVVDIIVKSKSDNTIFNKTYNIAISIPTEGMGKATQAQITGSFEGNEMIFTLYNTSATTQVFKGIVYDLKGNIRWYSAIPNSYMQFVLNDRLYVGYKGEKINRLGVYNFLGKQEKDWELPGWEDIHHDLLTNELGNLIVTVSKDDNSPVEEHLIEFNPNSNQSNKIVNSIDLSKIFPNVDELFPDLPQGQLGGTRLDNVHNNSVSYYKKDGKAIYICSSQRSGIAAVDQNGFPQWYFFPKNVQYVDFNDSTSGKRLPAGGSFPELDYSEPPSYEKLLVKPIDNNGQLITDTEVINEGKVKEGVDFVYPFRQHGARVIDYNSSSVTFVVLDNGLFRGFETHKNNATSRAVCYKVTFSDESYGGTIQQLWSTNMEFFSPFLGQSHKTPVGNYIFTFGAIGSTFFVGDNSDYKNSSDTEKKTVIVELNSSGQEQGRLTIPTTNESFGVGAYRAERIDL